MLKKIFVFSFGLFILNCTNTTLINPSSNPSIPISTISPSVSIPSGIPTIKPFEISDIKYSNLKTRGLQYTYISQAEFVKDGNYLVDTRTENYFPYHITLGYFRDSSISEEFEANVFFKDGSNYNKNIIWDSSDRSIFTIEDGKLKAYKAGQADIIIKLKDNNSNTEILRAPIVIFGEKYIPPTPTPTGIGSTESTNNINMLITGKVTDSNENPLDEVKISIEYKDVQDSLDNYMRQIEKAGNLQYINVEKVNNSYKSRVAGNLQFTDINGNYKFIAPDLASSFPIEFTASKKGYKSSTILANFNSGTYIYDFSGQYSLQKE